MIEDIGIVLALILALMLVLVSHGNEVFSIIAMSILLVSLVKISISSSD